MPKSGITIVLVTHEPDIAKYARRLVRFVEGTSPTTAACLSSDGGGARVIAPMLAEAWHAMGANRLRTFLTMLGMMIGVAAVIMMLAIGQGAQYAVDQSIASMGSNLFIIMSGSTPRPAVFAWACGATPTLTTGDADAIGGTAVDWRRRAHRTRARHRSSTARTTGARGGTGRHPAISRYATGPSRQAIRSPTRTCAPLRASRCSAKRSRRTCSATTDPVGKTIRIKQSPFLVIGVLRTEGTEPRRPRSGRHGVRPGDHRAEASLFGTQFPGSVRFIAAQATSAEAMTAAERDMTQLLRQRHHLPERSDNDFDIRNLTALANAAAQTTRVMSIMLGAIASISLLVGGIGIMNIMLVSVTERTREIGIRMAIGARERDIRAQFLLEAIIISLIGCMVGVLLGVGAAVGANLAASIPVVVTGASVLLAFLVATGVGVFFGFYPANRAARLKPIDALRYQ